MKHSLASPDFLCGLLLCCVSAGFLVASRDYDLGTAARMGPAFFPAIMACLLGIVGIALCIKGLGIKGLGTKGAATPRTLTLAQVKVRPLLGILLSIGSFGLLVRPAGLIAALFVSMVLACLANRETKPRELLSIVVVLVTLGTLFFHTVLKLPVSLWPL